ncbi:hypothetical protein XFF6970_270003 [Xanthomonas citri pv. fuscans]|nr:hypothetical protein XFF6970_270003 [Xanthomonas citri pv. fuscans]
MDHHMDLPQKGQLIAKSFLGVKYRRLQCRRVLRGSTLNVREGEIKSCLDSF